MERRRRGVVSMVVDGLAENERNIPSLFFLHKLLDNLEATKIKLDNLLLGIKLHEGVLNL